MNINTQVYGLISNGTMSQGTVIKANENKITVNVSRSLSPVKVGKNFVVNKNENNNKIYAIHEIDYEKINLRDFFFICGCLGYKELEEEGMKVFRSIHKQSIEVDEEKRDDFLEDFLTQNNKEVKKIIDQLKIKIQDDFKS